MFVRFRETPDRVHVSLVETRRCNGRVKHEHVASFGSILKPLTVDERLAFWTAVHERLRKLANRVSNSARILGQIHARIPMVIIEEQDALTIEHAKSHELFWTRIGDAHQETIEGCKHVIMPTHTRPTAWPGGGGRD
jgi:hypothetical protein